MTFRPIVIAATGLISIFTLKHPNRFISLSKKAIATWGLIRTLRSSLNSSNQK
ncbi:YqjK-like family protein [Providencia sp. wls1950]|nr:YqjK-like family protein [Providencia sp. wls1950]